MAVRLRLYGEVGWSIDGHFSAIGGSTRLGVILALAEAQGDVVSVASILDRLWATVPSSGANAVQRHVSALRRQLHGLGVADPGRIIETGPGGYRFGAAVSDLTLARHGSFGGDEQAVRWWEEPLVGAPWEPTQSLRAQLEQLAGAALVQWSSQLKPGRLREADDRARLILNHSPGNREAARIREQSAAKLREADGEPLLPAGLRILSDVAGLWAGGRSAEALDLLNAQTAAIPDGLVRHVNRAVIWLSPKEPWVRSTLLDLIEDAIANPVQHERSVVSLAARVLEQRHDGRHAAQVEIAGAQTQWERIRALRIALMLGLSAPHDRSQEELATELGAIDHPDARVEASRFRFLAQLRLMNLAEAKRLLGEYQAAVDLDWPGTGDDFALVSAAGLQRSTDAQVAATFGPLEPRLGGFVSDRWVVPLADSIYQLVNGGAALAEADMYAVAATGSYSMNHSIRLLQALNAGAPVADQAHELAAELPSTVREKQFMILPIALALVALSLQDRELADAAAKAMRPWAGQMLGLWPVDFCFGPADRWLECLAAVSPSSRG